MNGHGTQASSTTRKTRFSLDLAPQRSLVDADLIVLGSGVALTAQELEQVLQVVDPDGYEVHPIPNDAVFAAASALLFVLVVGVAVAERLQLTVPLRSLVAERLIGSGAT